MALKEEFEKTGNRLFKRRSYFPLIILPILLIALREGEYIERVFGNTAETYWEAFCLALSFIGLSVRCITIGYVPKRTSGRNTEGQVAETLNTTGIYSLARHPLYLGNFLIFLGMVLFIQVVWFSILAVSAFWLYYERIMFAEEEFLRNKFDNKYLQWAEKTPAFIPNFRNWQKPDIPFSFKNVLRREYTSFFQIGIFFPLLDIGMDFFGEGKLKIDLFWILLFIITFGTYIILRTLKRKSTILHAEGR